MSYFDRSNRIGDQTLSQKVYSRNEYGGPLSSATYHKSRSMTKRVNDDTTNDSITLNSKTETSSAVTMKVFVATVLIITIVAVLGGASYLSYYLGTQNSKVINNTVYSNSGSLESSIIDSVILSKDEQTALISLGPNIGGFTSFTLLYRATRDGFFGNIFHQKCDSKSPTVVLIKSNLNSVFGGYTAALWNPSSGYKQDSTAFIFSLRRRGFNSTEKFPILSPNHAINTPTSNSMPVFGRGNEIYICDSSDILNDSFTNCVGSYTCPSGGNTHLAGLNSFYTSEIEVFQVSI